MVQISRKRSYGFTDLMQFKEKPWLPSMLGISLHGTKIVTFNTRRIEGYPKG